jgi:hypothetical protein
MSIPVISLASLSHEEFKELVGEGKKQEIDAASTLAQVSPIAVPAPFPMHRTFTYVKRLYKLGSGLAIMKLYNDNVKRRYSA